LVKRLLRHIYINKFPDKSKSDMKLPVKDLDFFLNLIKEHKLGTKLIEAWVNFMMPSTDHLAGHIHPYATGVYYLLSPKNSGNLKFPDMNLEIEPRENLFLVVPKAVTHSITENKSNGLRISLAFFFE